LRPVLVVRSSLARVRLPRLRLSLRTDSLLLSSLVCPLSQSVSVESATSLLFNSASLLLPRTLQLAPPFPVSHGNPTPSRSRSASLGNTRPSLFLLCSAAPLVMSALLDRKAAGEEEGNKNAAHSFWSPNVPSSSYSRVILVIGLLAAKPLFLRSPPGSPCKLPRCRCGCDLTYAPTRPKCYAMKDGNNTQCVADCSTPHCQLSYTESHARHQVPAPCNRCVVRRSWNGNNGLLTWIWSWRLPRIMTNEVSCC